MTLDLEKNIFFWFTKFLEGEYQEWPPGGDLDVNKQKKKRKKQRSNKAALSDRQAAPNGMQMIQEMIYIHGDTLICL